MKKLFGVSRRTDNITNQIAQRQFIPALHRAYDAAFPSWILTPDESTLQKYIQHEKTWINYQYLISQAATICIPPRSLLVDHSFKPFPSLIGLKQDWSPLLLYQSTIISPSLPLQRFDFPVGQRLGLVNNDCNSSCSSRWSTPVRPIFLGSRGWQRGVPVVFQALVLPAGLLYGVRRYSIWHLTFIHF